MRISDWSSDVCSSDLRDCVILVAQGKTDWEIGKIFGLKKDSVTKVIDAARMRYDVANRTELVVAALFDGQVSFNEVRHWRSEERRVGTECVSTCRSRR